MLTRLKSTLVATALIAAPIATIVTVSPADAVPGKKYSSCDKLHKDFKHGVARSPKAAAKQVRDGYGRPSTTKKAKSVYRTNKANLDRDKDGTACEA
ncbi:MAG: excalibur calcium-binding domain-containing protein [Actinomycetota bacterium]|nr:excalibur calcium-binding domain-containing protein [Actinomycetota bacterium]